MIKGSEDIRYSFPIGVIRVWETKLLTKSHYDRLLALPNEREIIPSLHDTIYGQYRDLPFEEILERVLERAFNLLVRFCVDPEVIDLLLLPKKIHNLKVELKGRIRECDYRDLLYDVEGTVEGTEDVLARFLETKDPFLLEAGLDRIELERSIALSHRFPFLTNYYLMKADLYNLSSIIRLKRLGLGRRTGLAVLIPTTTFDPERLAGLLDQDLDAIRSFFLRIPYHDIVIQGLDYLEKKNSFLRLERLIDEELLRYMKMARRFVFGIEPLFSYYSFLEAEVIRLRRIYIGKLHRLPVEEIRESLPEVY
ncbi:hypothetical protein DRP53_09985 [candidate division WOR-3 bacterium]|uniref:V-type ATP synthase subunit C n=1 Tax=candidate division WOR-3 bacterium TaxID=2052148 RepID=A0A660SD93_UNCW3|nr:MAG: hypothetical protein DRP53_09985 [candidate division WOR-3 bacterium]